MGWGEMGGILYLVEENVLAVAGVDVNVIPDQSILRPRRTSSAGRRKSESWTAEDRGVGAQVVYNVADRNGA